MSDVWDDIQSCMRAIEKARRTVICPVGLGDRVRAMLDQTGMGGLYDVTESPYIPAGQVFMLDHNALRIDTREEITW